MTPPEVGYFCSKCSQYNVYRLPLSPESIVAGTCAACGKVDAPRPTAAVSTGGPIDRCPQCENGELYTRKDFPQQLGCAAVVTTIVASSVAYAIADFPAALAVLVVASVFDLALYHRLPDVTVCYRCHAEMRRFSENPSHGPFDMHRAEEYEHESPT